MLPLAVSCGSRGVISRQAYPHTGESNAAGFSQAQWQRAQCEAFAGLLHVEGASREGSSAWFQCCSNAAEFNQNSQGEEHEEEDEDKDGGGEGIATEEGGG